MMELITIKPESPWDVESLNEFIDFDNLGDHRPNIINYLFQK